MSVVIRMRRTGRRNRPCYRISVADSRLPRDGRAIESIGLYDPASPLPDLRLDLDVERARHWIAQGARPSDTVASIFKKQGVYEGLPQKQKRKRTGRGKATATRARRTAEKQQRTERKAGRRRQEAEAKAAAAAAARAAAAAEAAAAEEPSED